MVVLVVAAASRIEVGVPRSVVVAALQSVLHFNLKILVRDHRKTAAKIQSQNPITVKSLIAKINNVIIHFNNDVFTNHSLKFGTIFIYYVKMGHQDFWDA